MAEEEGPHGPVGIFKQGVRNVAKHDPFCWKLAVIYRLKHYFMPHKEHQQQAL